MMPKNDRRLRTRRTFLVLFAQGVAAIAFWSPSRRWRRPEADTPLQRALLETLDGLPMRYGSARLGRLYLRRHPHEANSSALLTELAHRVRDVAAPADLTPPQRLAVTIREDFERGDMVNVGGWLLSTTEARALALISLL